ncbi:MAG: leucyl aminopeptidase, partial [Mycobacterium sp.]|nr:leucyl aminopeptidase [Mycobacterium sp.]
MSTEPGYQSPSVTVTSALPRRGTGSAVLIIPIVSSGDEDQPGFVVTVPEPFLPVETVAEIDAGLRALEATGAGEQVNR